PRGRSRRAPQRREAHLSRRQPYRVADAAREAAVGADARAVRPWGQVEGCIEAAGGVRPGRARGGPPAAGLTLDLDSGVADGRAHRADELAGAAGLEDHAGS